MQAGRGCDFHAGVQQCEVSDALASLIFDGVLEGNDVADPKLPLIGRVTFRSLGEPAPIDCRGVETMGLEPTTPALQRRPCLIMAAEVSAGQGPAQEPVESTGDTACPAYALRDRTSGRASRGSASRSGTAVKSTRRPRAMQGGYGPSIASESVALMTSADNAAAMATSRSRVAC